MVEPNFLATWKKSANFQQIPEESYRPKVRVVSDPSGRSSYTFGVIFNPHRFQRPNIGQSGECPLCNVVSNSYDNPILNLVYGGDHSFVVVANQFPTHEAHSLAVDRGTLDKEKAMYTTRDLGDLAQRMNEVFSFANRNNVRVFHNSEGAGASIPRHEHWHLTNFLALYGLIGEEYGFENASCEPTKEDRYVNVMPHFPFAHLLFDDKDPDKIVSFLRRLDRSIGTKFGPRGVPHVLCQGREGILVVPARYKERGIGAGDIAGHHVVKTIEEFEKADFDFCIARLNEQLIPKEEVRLESLL